MAEPLHAVESNGDATKLPGGVTGKGFQPGQSGNPGGRRKGIAAKVRELCGDDGEELVLFWLACKSGILETVVYEHTESYRDKSGRLRKKVVPEHTIRETVPINDRIAVSKILGERGYGKPPQYVPIEDDNPLDFGDKEANSLAAEFDSKIGDIEAKRREREEREAEPPPQ